jgi:hypothetical protein
MLVRTCDFVRTTRASKLFSIGVVLASLLHLLANTFPPRVENPLPESIGWTFPISLAGAFGVLAGVIRSKAPTLVRDRSIRLGGYWGFWVGVVLYGLALAFQVGWR